MRSNDRNILMAVAGVVVLVAFWFVVLSPKRSQVSDLDTQVSELQQSIESQQQRIDYGRQARSRFSSNYRKVVVLGKAAPEQSDTASLLVQLNDLAKRSGVDFRALELDGGDEAAAAPTATPAPSEPGQTGGTASPEGTPTSQPAAAPPTEAAAATVAIGASVGPAGLNTLKYKLIFRGDFFAISSFMASVDRLVSSKAGRVSVNGRLSTVDGFSLAADALEGFPTLDAQLAVTTYLTPVGQGVTAGATPEGPPTSLPGQFPQLASSRGTTP